MPAAITWRRGGMIPAPFRIISGTRTFSIRCATLRWHPTASKTSGMIEPWTARRREGKDGPPLNVTKSPPLNVKSYRYPSLIAARGDERLLGLDVACCQDD